MHASKKIHLKYFNSTEKLKIMNFCCNNIFTCSPGLSLILYIMNNSLYTVQYIFCSHNPFKDVEFREFWAFCSPLHTFLIKIPRISALTALTVGNQSEFREIRFFHWPNSTFAVLNCCTIQLSMQWSSRR